MNWLTTTFILFPCTSAIAVGWGVRHWALAAALVAGGLGVLMLASSIPFGAFRVVIPFATGAAVAGLALVPLLLWKPQATLWSRLIAALVAAFGVHFLYLHLALAGA